jgi:hypothetical protein
LAKRRKPEAVKAPASPAGLQAVVPWAGLHAGGRAPRALAALAAVAAWSLTWWVLRGTVWFAAGAAAAAGSLAADHAASWVRQRAALGGALAALLAAPFLRAMVAFVFALFFGADAALWSSELVFVAVAVAAVAAFLRTLALHHPAWRGVEVAALGAAIASPVLAHRDGAWARPLALSDAAIQAGLDPLHVLVGLGVLAGFGAVVLLAAERTQRPERAAALVLVPAVVLALLLVVVGGSVVDLVEEVSSRSDTDAETDDPAGGGGKDGEEASAEGKGAGDGVADGAAEGRGSPDPTAPPPPSAGGDPGDRAPAGPSDGATPTDGRQPASSGGQQPASDGGQAPPLQGDGELNGDQPPPSGGGQRPPSGGGQPPPSGGGQPPPSGGGQAPPEGGQPPPADGPKPPPSGGAAPPPTKGAEPPPDDGAEPPPKSDQPPSDPPPDPGDASGASGGDPLEQLFEDGKSSGDPAPVAVVILDDDYLPPGETWYLRQDALSELVGYRLMPSGVDQDVPRGPMVGEEQAAAPAPDDDREPLTGRVAALIEQTAWFGPEAAVSYKALDNPDRSRFVAAWRFSSLVPEADPSALFGRTSSAAIWPGYLQVPPDPRYAAKVAELLEPVPADLRKDPMAVALSITHGIGVDMVYDKGVVFEPDTDQAAAFLFGGMRGYCVHAAHAAVYLMRAAGVPARVGTGYAVPGTSLRGSTLLVRALEAHAWPEVWIDGAGWTIVDVHPEKSVTPPPPPVDDALVRQLGEAAREATGEAPPEPPDAPWRPNLRLPRLPWAAIGRALSTLALWLLVGTVGGHYAAKIVRRVRPRLSAPGALPRDALVAALDLLAEVGLSREAGETREAHARRIADRAPTFTALSAHATRAAFGPDDAPPDRLLLLGLLDGVRAELRASVPWWRRLAGALDLTSVWRVR